ncbi:MAG: GNAT family N-acetyltransferase [Promethearchaeota archaeon]|nr:MAG: GNAT family N-acetyltransferase [Candidatus Lokiarchaeota archaeon]
MFEVRELKYSQSNYNKILGNLKKSLQRYFVETIHEDLKEADFWYERIERVIKSNRNDIICFEIRSDEEVIGIMTTSLINEQFFLIRHFFIIDIDNKEEAANILLKETIERLKQKYKINKFKNVAFTFPDDYLANPLKRIGFNILKRHNMTLNLKSYKKTYELPPEFSLVPFNEEDMLKIAELSVQIYKNHPDASFWEETNSVSLYLEYLEKSMETYFLPECSLLVNDERKNIIGFCLVEKGDQENEFIIQDIAVNELNRGRGIGKALISRVLNITRDRGYKKAILTVTDGNPAQKLYESFGFKKYTSFNVITNK